MPEVTKTPGGSCYDVLLTNASSQAEAISNTQYKAWATNVGIRCPKESLAQPLGTRIVVLSAVVVARSDSSV